MNDCPCGSKDPYGSCCEPHLKGTTPAATPEALMRSRYAAHVRGNAGYLVASTLPEQQSELDLADLNTWIKETSWKALRILATGQTDSSSEQGWVEFEALYEQLGKHYLHSERSVFERRAGRWFFDMHPDTEQWTANYGSQLLGRNDSCPCGSGRKLKKCCALT